ncbi:hypothetical protein ABH922_004826 [Rhodococcus sp. 27YEA15]|uniref:hypothetical protein n=1 Tax=Rhodococcus sp. 27YEA15 TaxID=3156259 RepID=UPI003C7C37CD
MTSPSSDEELAIAKLVSAKADAFWRKVTAQVVRGVLFYAVFAGLMSLVVKLYSLDNSFGVHVDVVLRVEPELGAGILGVLVGAIAVLHVAAWATELGSGSEVAAETRKNYLASTGLAIGQLSVYIGVAVLLNDAPERLEFSGFAIAIMSVVLVVISADVGHLVSKDIPVQGRIHDARRETEIHNLQRVVADWHPVATTSGYTFLRIGRDLAAIALVAVSPAVVFLVYRELIDHQHTSWDLVFGMTVLAPTFAIVVAVGSILVPTRLFYGREFGVAVFLTLTGILTYLTTALTIVLVVWSVGTAQFYVATRSLCLAFAIIAPAVLVQRGVSGHGPAWLPGHTLRDVVFHSLTRRIAHLQRLQARANTPQPSLNRRFVSWLNRKTGVQETP